MASISHDFYGAWGKIEEICHSQEMEVYINDLLICASDKLDKENFVNEVLPALRFPVVFTVKPEIDGQINLFSFTGSRERNPKPRLRIIFGKNSMVLDFVNDFKIDDDTLQSIKNNAKKIYIGVLHQYFILTQMGEFVPCEQNICDDMAQPRDEDDTRSSDCVELAEAAAM
jgi:hypothetical protein